MLIGAGWVVLCKRCVLSTSYYDLLSGLITTVPMWLLMDTTRVRLDSGWLSSCYCSNLEGVVVVVVGV